MKKYEVRLSEGERKRLNEIIKKGKEPAYKIMHANVLLKADANGLGWRDKQIADSFSVCLNTVFNIRKRYTESGLERALNLNRPEEPPHKKKLDGAGEARLIALSCSKPPEGHARWDLKLLADKSVELEIVDSISYETVRKTLKKTRSGHSGKRCGRYRPRRMGSL
jgi:transposase